MSKVRSIREVSVREDEGCSLSFGTGLRGGTPVATATTGRQTAGHGLITQLYLPSPFR